MKYFLIGDQGVSMAGIKKILAAQGHDVGGSDLKTGGHDPKNISPDLDAVIYTSAALPGSPADVEVEAAKKLKIPLFKRSEFIGRMLPDQKIIAVTGMHGKTTTASMIAQILENAGLDPSALIGAPAKDDRSARLGTGEYFVVEACEYDRSFLDFPVVIGIITNIEPEHLDYYRGGLPEIVQAFSQFISRTGKCLIAWTADKNINQAIAVARPKPAKIIRYGLDSGDIKQTTLNLAVGIIGQHNILNALAAYSLAQYLGIDDRITRKALRDFSGAKRRLEKVGTVGNTIVIDDYGHHPTEIEATLSALSEHYPNKPLIVVFQPHQASRLRELFKGFSTVFGRAARVIILPVFQVPGRDEPEIKTSQDLVRALKKQGVNSCYLPDYNTATDELKKILGKNQIILTLGATDVYQIAENLIHNA